MPHSVGWDEENDAVRADERSVENLRRVRASRREPPWATRVTPPENYDPDTEDQDRQEVER